MKEWENMRDFAIAMIKEATKHMTEGIIDQRIAIMHLDHATELLMKAFLFKEGYFIYDIDKNILKKGIKTKDLPNSDRLINFTDCLNIVSERIKLDPSTKSKVLKFRKIRNEIQHRATNLPFNKGEEIINYSPALNELYHKMFPEHISTFPEIKQKEEE